MRLNMMLRKSMVFLLGIILFSCNQDPIFFSISQEVKPRDPRIKGTPTTIVQLDKTVYVASKFSRTIHQYTGEWDTLPSSPGGKILELAATTKNLYALTGDIGSTQIYKYDGSNWQEVPNGSGNIQSLYGAGDCIFAGVMTSDGKFELFYKKESDSELKPLKSDAKLLTGAVYDGSTYYLATAGDGIYTFNGSDTSTLYQVTSSAGLAIVGIINVENQIVAINRDSKILYKTTGSFTLKDVDGTFTGALGLWKKENENVYLLLLGIQGSSTSNGYREIELTPDGKLDPSNMGLNAPGSNKEKSSVANADKYNASLRRHPIVALFQAPDGILFAATLKNGLWSYRNEWNTEE